MPIEDRSAINEVEIIRLNIERYRRMLQTDLDDATRRTVQRMLDEFEGQAFIRKRRSIRPSK